MNAIFAGLKEYDEAFYAWYKEVRQIASKRHDPFPRDVHDLMNLGFDVYGEFDAELTAEEFVDYVQKELEK